jgi:hypothetical protein
MAELWGDDDYLYGDYLKWRRRMPLGLTLLCWLVGVSTIGLFVYLCVYLCESY